MKKEISSLDLYFILKELDCLVGSKVDKLFYDNKNLLLQLHVPSKGKYLINAMVPSYFYLASQKYDFPQTPGGFCTFLRKYLNNSRVKLIRQIGFERIIEIIFETKEAEYIMVIELFSKGNIVLCKDDYIIMSAIETKRFGSRMVRGGVKYEYPRKEHNLLEITAEELKQILNSTDKESIVTALAIDFSLGGLYAEEVCAIADIDKNEKPSKVDSDLIFKAIKNILSHKLEPIVTENDEIYPFKLKSKNISGTEFETFNSAINEIITKSLISIKSIDIKSKHDTKIDKAKLIIKRQEKQILEMEKSCLESTRKGELIYEKYQLINEILTQINDAKKKLSYAEIKAKLKGHKIIKDMDEKNQTILVEL